MNPTRSSFKVNMFLLLFVLLMNYNLNFSAVAYRMMSNLCRMVNNRGRHVSYQNYSQHVYPRSISQYDKYFQDYTKRTPLKRRESDVEPLFVTPYITRGQLKEAVSLSRVKAPLNQSYESYSGFFTVNSIHNSHLFFWFFPTIRENKTAHLIVWLEGGSKYASSYRVFRTMGPYVLENGRIRNNSHHLLENYHVLYIDTPVGAGFSFTEHAQGYSHSIEQAAEDVYTALDQFSKIFPEVVENGIFLTGEFFMSKIAVAAAHSIRKHRIQMHNVSFTTLGLILPNPFVDPIHMSMTSKFLYQLGIVDLGTLDELNFMEMTLRRLIVSSEWYLANEMYENIMSILTKIGYEHPYDFTKHLADDAPDRKVLKFLSRPKIREAIHVGSLSYDSIQNSFCYLADDYLRSVNDMISDLVNDHRFLFYTGQFGIEVNHPKVMNFLRHLRWLGAVYFQSKPLRNCCIDGEFIGYQITCPQVMYTLIRNSSMFYLTVNPKWTISLWNTFTKNITNYELLEQC